MFSLIQEYQCGCGLAWSRTEASQASNPGSNPGSRTTPIFGKALQFFLMLVGLKEIP